MQAFARVWVIVSIIPVFMIAGCGDGDRAFLPPPPPDVTVGRPLRQDVTDHLDYTATTSARESVEIRARVQGFLDKVAFEPGSGVKAGDLLFVIDPRPFQAKVAQVQANLESKDAAFELAQINLDKAAQLLKTSSISEIQFLENKAKRDIAQADVAVAKADLEEAQLNLDYTLVKSPIKGRVSRNLVDLGNLVGAAEKTLLTTVVNDDTIYAYFAINENDLLALIRQYGPADRDPASERTRYPVFMALADETDFPHKGFVDFVDNQLDKSTGTLKARAVFPNDKGALLAGLFARVRLPLKTRQALLVPNLAVGLDQGGRYVLLVNKDNAVEQRAVDVGPIVGRMRVVEKGIAETDRIIINGMQRARPGAKVNPILATNERGADSDGKPKQAQ